MQSQTVKPVASSRYCCPWHYCWQHSMRRESWWGKKPQQHVLFQYFQNIPIFLIQYTIFSAKRKKIWSNMVDLIFNLFQFLKVFQSLTTDWPWGSSISNLHSLNASFQNYWLIQKITMISFSKPRVEFQIMSYKYEYEYNTELNNSIQTFCPEIHCHRFQPINPQHLVMKKKIAIKHIFRSSCTKIFKKIFNQIALFIVMVQIQIFYGTNNKWIIMAISIWNIFGYKMVIVPNDYSLTLKSSWPTFGTCIAAVWQYFLKAIL